MAVVRNLMVRAGADFSQMKTEMQKAQTEVQTFGSKISKAMNMVTIALSSIAGLTVFTDMVKDAVKVEGSIQSLGKLMGENANGFIKWANTSAAAFGMSKKDAIVFGKTYANLTSQFSANTQETMTNTQELLKASAVVASGTGRTMEDVLDRIRSGMLGNTEAIEDLGVFVNVAMIESTDAFKRFANGKSWNQLGFQTQQQIRYFAILEQITKKFGSEIADTTGSRLMTFQANLSNLKLALGTAFLPILNIVLPILTKFMQKLAYAAEFVAQTVKFLFGGKNAPSKKAKEETNSIAGVTDAFNENAQSVMDTGKAMKKAAKEQKGFLAGFDEINQVQIADPESAAANAISVPEIPMPQMDLGDLDSTVLDGLYDQTVELPNGFKKALEKIRNFVKKYKEQIKLIWLGLLGPIVSPFLIPAIIFKKLYENNELFRNSVDRTWSTIKTVGKWVYDNVLVPVGNIVKNVIIKAWEDFSNKVKWVWQNILVPIGKWLKDFKDKVIEPVAKTLLDVLGFAFETLAGIAQSFWENALKPMAENMQEKLQPAVEDLKVAFEEFFNKVLKPIGKFIGDNLLSHFESLAKKFDQLWKDKLKPFLSWAREKLKPVFDTVFTAIGDKMNSIVDIAAGIIKFFTGVFQKDMAKALEGLKGIFKGVFDDIAAPFKAIFNGIMKPFINNTSTNKNNLKQPKVPKLAKGGIVNNPTLAMVGEAGSEMVVPLENTSFVDKVASALGSAVMSAMQFTQGNTQGMGKDVVIQIDGHTIAKAINPYTKKENTRVGGSMLTVL